MLVVGLVACVRACRAGGSGGGGGGDGVACAAACAAALPPSLRFSRSAPLARCASQKWSKGKVKEKLANLVLFDKTTYEKMLSDVPKQKLITPSIISEKLKVNGSLARKAVRELVSKNLIRPILTHKQQAIYTRATNQ